MIESIVVNLAEIAGTKQPICAIITATQVILKSVDLPAALAPVNRATWFLSSTPSETSFGMKSFVPETPPGMKQGCLNSLKSMKDDSDSSTNSGRHIGYPNDSDDLVKEIIQSISANFLTTVDQTLESLSNFAYIFC
ncbi:unnamed protein product [[Candida] boidinii]|nr:unnamed protein product [[Candida] boidinii]